MKKPVSKLLSLLLAMAMAVSCTLPVALAAEITEDNAAVAAASEEETEIVAQAEESAEYEVSVSASQTEGIQAGDTVTLNISVTNNGEEITDLASDNLNITTWLDYYEANGHADGNSDASIASSNDLVTDVTLPSEGTYYLVTELYDSSWNTLASATTTFQVEAADAEEDGNETETPAEYAVSVSASQTEGIKAGDTVTLDISVTNNGEEITDLASDNLNITTWLDYYEANGHADGNSDASIASANDLVTDVTLPSEGTYYLVTELYDSSWNTLASATTTFQVGAASVELTAIPLENGDFEDGTANWTLSGFSSVASDSWNTDNTTNTLNLWLSDGEDTYGSAAYTVTLTAGTYQFGFDLSGAEASSGLSVSVTAGNTELVSGTEVYATTGYGNWATYETDTFTLTEDTEVTFALAGTVPAGYWGNLDNLTLKGTGSVVEDDTSVEADINVAKVKNLPDDFIMGMDISSVISEFNSGVTYQDFDGNTIDNVTDFCKFLAECGVTHVRVRIWNDPYDADHNSYGGGNNDIATAVEIAEGCEAAGLKLLLDFHCSDFWTDPSKQQTPKAWEGYTLEEKANALQEFLADSLAQIKATGAEIAMVQVGNETTGGFIGETSVANMCTLFNAGSAAIREFDPAIKVVIHVTNPEKSTMTTWAKNLDTYSVDYDILATSYYPSWHGTLANLKSQLETVRNTYGKDVMVAETSYAFTLDETDGHGNTVAKGNNDTMMCETTYPFTPQGQASYLRDIINTVNEAGGLGVYYWESAWITVGDTTGLTGDDYDARVEANKAIWEKYGSGWASSYSAQYDPDDAGVWYGGSAVDNQAMFYADGSPVASINVWNYVKTGAVSNHISVDEVAASEEIIEAGDAYTLPETITVTYNNGAVEEAVVWNEDDVNAIDVNAVGTYVVNGTVTFSKEVDSGAYAGQTTAATTYTLTVKAPNLIDADDASFEGNAGDHFTINGNGINLPATDDPKEGSQSMHWYYASATVSSVTYNEVITLAPGTYTFEAAAQGYAGDTVALNILDTEENVLFSGEPVALMGWAVWMTPSVSFEVSEETQIKLQVVVNMQAGGWGTADCLYLYKTGDVDVHTHSYGAPVFNWSEDNSACTATFTCVDGDDSQTVDCVVTSETTEPTEKEDGKTVYTAAVEFDGQTYTDTVTVTIPATGSPSVPVTPTKPHFSIASLVKQLISWIIGLWK